MIHWDTPQPLDAVTEPPRRLSTVLLDEALAGGLPVGTVTLLAGPPGIGKSSLAVQVAGHLAQEHAILYACGEEAPERVRARATRCLTRIPERVYTIPTARLEAIRPLADQVDVVIVDSLQTSSSKPTSAGLARAASRLVELARDTRTALLVIGHVTKAGAVAGPRAVEHAVDIVMTLEPAPRSRFLVLTARKNRFGPTGEPVLLRMSDVGLELVQHPGVALVADQQPQVGRALMRVADGARLSLVEVECLLRADGRSRRSGIGIPNDRVRALFAGCAADQSPAGVRDAAILAVAYGAGLRREEIVRLDLADYESETGALTVSGGKGRKDRIGYAANGSKDAIEAWLELRGTDPGALFVPINKSGRLALRRMIPHALYVVMQKRAKQAGVKAFSPHDLRRSFISDLLDAGADLAVAQQLAGHANIATTARHDRRGEVAKRRASQLLRGWLPIRQLSRRRPAGGRVSQRRHAVGSTTAM